MHGAVEPGAQIVTDGWDGYNGLAEKGYRHVPVAISGNPATIEDYLPIVHLMFGNLKSWLRGCHHGVSPQHLQAYLNEFPFRFNRRFYPFNSFRSLLGIGGRTGYVIDVFIGMNLNEEDFSVIPAFSEADIKRGLDCYDPEQRVFPAFSGTERKRKLDERDVLLILKWKLGRIKASNAATISVGNLEKINTAIEIAGSPKREHAALKILECVPGIGLATATAVPTVCYPDHFTIIDQRVLEALDLFPSRLAAHQPRNYSTYDWTTEDYVSEYLPRIREVSKQWGRSLRDTDRALWGISVSRRIERIKASNQAQEPPPI